MEEEDEEEECRRELGWYTLDGRLESGCGREVRGRCGPVGARRLEGMRTRGVVGVKGLEVEGSGFGTEVKSFEGGDR